MQFDTYALQVLQAARDNLANEPLDSPRGICDFIVKAETSMKQLKKAAPVYPEVLREAYMPHLSVSVFWWPINKPWQARDLDSEEQELWRAERLAFLDRVIEDLMCGEPFRIIPGGPSNA